MKPHNMVILVDHSRKCSLLSVVTGINYISSIKTGMVILQ